MKKTSKPIIFFGNERIATGVSTSTSVLKALIDAGYQIASVVSNYTPGQSRQNRELEVAQVAGQHGIPVLLPDHPRDIAQQLKSYGAEVAVLVAYGKIVPQSVIDIFPKGIVNIHPSLLPLHRGPTPLESVILSGETKTGVSIMSLAKEMDAGPVFAQENIALNGTESKQELANILLNKGAEMLIQHLPNVIDGSLTPNPQDDQVATYDSLINKEDGVLEWTKPASRLEREIRAYASWPNSTTTLGGKDVIVTKAHVVDVTGKPGDITIESKQIIVSCGEQALSLDELKPAGKGVMSAAAFLAGNKIS